MTVPEVLIGSSVALAGGVGALMLQAGSPAGAVDLAKTVASSVPDSVWITAAVIVAVKFVISTQVKKLVEMPPKQVIFEAIERVEKLVTKFVEDIMKIINANHIEQLGAIKTLRAEIAAVDKRVDVIEAAKKLEIGIGDALKAAKGTQ